MAWAAATTMVLLGLSAAMDAGVAVPLVVLATVLTVADNGLAFTAVAERAGPHWSGRALGLQNTAQFLASALVPPLVAVVLLAASLPFWYEVVTRSTLVANGVLAAVLAWPMARAGGGRSLRHVSGWGALAGLLLSTRSVMSLVVGALAVFCYLRPVRWSALLSFGAVAVLVFAATVVPLWASDPAMFARVNPFAVQATQSMPVYTVLAIAAAVVAGRVAQTPEALLLGLGLALTLAVAMPFGDALVAGGWTATVTRSGADIAYFTMALPLLALGLAAGVPVRTEAP